MVTHNRANSRSGLAGRVLVYLLCFSIADAGFVLSAFAQRNPLIPPSQDLKPVEIKDSMAQKLDPNRAHEEIAAMKAQLKSRGIDLDKINQMREMMASGGPQSYQELMAMNLYGAATQDQKVALELKKFSEKVDRYLRRNKNPGHPGSVPPGEKRGPPTIQDLDDLELDLRRLQAKVTDVLRTPNFPGGMIDEFDTPIKEENEADQPSTPRPLIPPTQAKEKEAEKVVAPKVKAELIYSFYMLQIKIGVLRKLLGLPVDNEWRKGFSLIVPRAVARGLSTKPGVFTHVQKDSLSAMPHFLVYAEWGSDDAESVVITLSAGAVDSIEETAIAFTPNERSFLTLIEVAAIKQLNQNWIEIQRVRGKPERSHGVEPSVELKRQFTGLGNLEKRRKETRFYELEKATRLQVRKILVERIVPQTEPFVTRKLVGEIVDILAPPYRPRNTKEKLAEKKNPAETTEKPEAIRDVYMPDRDPDPEVEKALKEKEEQEKKEKEAEAAQGPKTQEEKTRGFLKWLGEVADQARDAVVDVAEKAFNRSKPGLEQEYHRARLFGILLQQLSDLEDEHSIASFSTHMKVQPFYFSKMTPDDYVRLLPVMLAAGKMGIVEKKIAILARKADIYPTQEQERRFYALIKDRKEEYLEQFSGENEDIVLNWMQDARDAAEKKVNVEIRDRVIRAMIDESARLMKKLDDLRSGKIFDFNAFFKGFAVNGIAALDPAQRSPLWAWAARISKRAQDASSTDGTAQYRAARDAYFDIVARQTSDRFIEEEEIEITHPKTGEKSTKKVKKLKSKDFLEFVDEHEFGPYIPFEEIEGMEKFKPHADKGTKGVPIDLSEIDLFKGFSKGFLKRLKKKNASDAQKALANLFIMGEIMGFHKTFPNDQPTLDKITANFLKVQENHDLGPKLPSHGLGVMEVVGHGITAVYNFCTGTTPESAFRSNYFGLLKNELFTKFPVLNQEVKVSQRWIPEQYHARPGGGGHTTGGYYEPIGGILYQALGKLAKPHLPEDEGRKPSQASEEPKDPFAWIPEEVIAKAIPMIEEGLSKVEENIKKQLRWLNEIHGQDYEMERLEIILTRSVVLGLVMKMNPAFHKIRTRIIGEYLSPGVLDTLMHKLVDPAVIIGFEGLILLQLAQLARWMSTGFRSSRLKKRAETAAKGVHERAIRQKASQERLRELVNRNYHVRRAKRFRPGVIRNIISAPAFFVDGLGVMMHAMLSTLHWGWVSWVLYSIDEVWVSPFRDETIWGQAETAEAFFYSSAIGSSIVTLDDKGAIDAQFYERNLRLFIELPLLVGFTALFPILKWRGRKKQQKENDELEALFLKHSVADEGLPFPTDANPDAVLTLDDIMHDIAAFRVMNGELRVLEELGINVDAINVTQNQARLLAEIDEIIDAWAHNRPTPEGGYTTTFAQRRAYWKSQFEAKQQELLDAVEEVLPAIEPGNFEPFSNLGDAVPEQVGRLKTFLYENRHVFMRRFRAGGESGNMFAEGSDELRELFVQMYREIDSAAARLKLRADSGQAWDIDQILTVTDVSANPLDVKAARILRQATGRPPVPEEALEALEAAEGAGR